MQNKNRTDDESQEKFTDPRRILVVEDETEIREDLIECLKSLDISVDAASNGKEGLDHFLAREYHTIITDINMPGMSGIKLFEAIRASGKNPPVIFLTANCSKDTTLAALRLGAFDFLEKPFNSERVIEVTKKALEVGIRRLKKEEILADATSGKTKDLSKSLKIFRSAKRMIGLFHVANSRKTKKN